MRLTFKEKEIVQILQMEPLISQDELAKRLGISRSSVAVHISNLMKKGFILGKGYVFNQKKSIVILGEVHLSVNVFMEHEKTTIDVVPGGFAVEVGETLAYFGTEARIFTMVGNDELADQMKSHMKKHNMDIQTVYRHPDLRTSRRILFNNDIQYEESIIFKAFLDYIDRQEWTISHCDYLIIQEKYQEYLSSKLTKNEIFPRLCGGLLVSKDIPIYLSQYSIVVLGTHDLNNRDYYIAQASQLVENGVEHCLITDGCNGIIYKSRKEIQDITLMPNQMFNPALQMHSFLAGMVFGISAGYPSRQAIRIAVGSVTNGNRKVEEFTSMID
ncbi:MAG: PfkB family carbohydrate kinase [Bacillota bacterium]|nr:PfkB family carbohydrate kinase [Bacillota bacterium]